MLLNSPAVLKTDEKIGNINIRAGDEFVVDIQFLHKNPKEWIRPEEFLPERFDPTSPLHLTPSGEKR